MTSLAAQTLFQHIRNKDINAVHNLIKTSLINLDERDRDGQTFLMVASQVGCAEILTILLEYPTVDINAVDNDNWTALLNAAKEGHVDVVCQLADRNADLEHRDMGGWTALMWACYKNRTEVVIELLDRGANANVRGEHNMSCLTWAAGRGYTEIVKLLLIHGAKPNTADKYGTTPLMWAARKGHKQIVDYLLEEGATIDNAGMNSWTALIMASKGGYSDVVSSILKFFPNVNAVDKDSYTALTHAAKEGHVDIVHQLLEKGAYVNRPDRYGDTILIHAAKGGHVEVVKALLKKHVDVDVQGVDEKTALYWAVEKGHSAVVKLLLDANANTEIATKGGDTPLLRAVKCKNLETTQLLLEKGAKASATDKKGDNVLHIAVRARSKRVTELLLRNPKDGRLLYRPNKNGETPYQLDAEHEKKILTQVFGARNLNADDNIEGYELYSSTIADVLSEPSLNTPITVGLYAKWGSGKSFLIKKLIKEMKNFTRHNVCDALFEFSGLQFFLSFMPCLLIGIIISLAFRWEVGLGIGLGLLLIQYIFLGVMWIGSVKKDWSWAYYLSVGFSKKLGLIKLLLQVMFCNEPASINRDTVAVRFLFTDNARLASVVGEKSITAMISTLCDSLEQEYGTLVTRLYKVLRPGRVSENGRFKSLCCVPYFIIVLFVSCCVIIVCCLVFFYGFEDIFDSDIDTVDGVVIAFIAIIGLAVLGNIYTWWCMVVNLIIPPRKRVQKIMAHADSLKMEGLMQNLKKEVELIGHMTRCMDSFRHTHTRLVIIVDGLDSCEQERLLQVLDTVHLLFSDDKSPYVTILAVDPHVIIKGIEHNLHGLFRDSSINGHDYLRNLVHLPFFLQSQTMPRTRYSIQRFERNSEVGTGRDPESASGHVNASVTYHKQESIHSVVSIPDLDKINNKKKHSPKKSDGGSNYFSSSSLVKQTSQQDLSKSMGKSSYFSDINPRSMKRMMNIIAVTGRLLRACNVEFNWYKLAAWINITEQWPYRLSWIIMEIEDNENIQQNMPLKNVYESIVPKLPSSKEIDPRLEIDRNERKLQVFLQNNRPMLTVGDLKRFMPCTINVDPYLRKLIKEQLQNAENMSYEFGLCAPSNGSYDMFGWPYGVRRPASRAEISPSGTPVPRPVSSVRLGMHGAATPLSMAGPAYGLYPPVMPYGQGLSFASMNVAQNARASPRINLQGELPSDSLTSMSVDDVCSLLTRLEGLDKSRLRSYVACLQENNISGPVLLTCELAELKPILQMRFGDWELFRNLVQVLREREMTNESTRTHDPNIATDDGVDGAQSGKIKFTQEIPTGSGVSIPQPSYANLGVKKQVSDQSTKTRDSYAVEQYKNRATPLLKKVCAVKLNTVGEHSEFGYYSGESTRENKGMTRKDSFFGEVMLESAALRGVVEAVGVNTDTGEDTDEETQREDSSEPEEPADSHHNHAISRHHKQPSMALSKNIEEDPRYKIGDSESGDSDSEEVFLLAHKASTRRTGKMKSPTNLPRLKLNSMKSMAMSNESLSGVCKESTLSNRISRTTSRDTVLKPPQRKPLSLDLVASKTSSPQSQPPGNEMENDRAPLLISKSGDHLTRKKAEEDRSSTSEYKTNAVCADGMPEGEDSVSTLPISPTPSCEHLALRKLSHSDTFNMPSAFKSVTPTSSRASSRASSLGVSLGSNKAISKEDSEDGFKMNNSNNTEGISVSRQSSRKISPISVPDIQDSYDIEVDSDQADVVVV